MPRERTASRTMRRLGRGVVAVAAAGLLLSGSGWRPTASTSELASIVAPPADVPFVGGGVTRGLDGAVTDADLVARQATEDAVRTPPLPPAPPGRQTLRPPVARRDFPDPSVIRAGDRYYAFSTNSGGRNVPVSSSTDLFHWSEPSDALPALPPWSGSGLAWAPSVAAVGGRYVLYVSLPQVADGGQCVDRFVADHPAGPYAAVSDTPLLCNTFGGSGVIDPQPLVAGGRVFLYWKSAGSTSRQIHVSELSADGLQVEAEPRHLLTATAGWEGGGVENPTMVQSGGGWWLLYSANWWVDERYRMGWAHCEGPTGPCRKGDGPWLASRDGVAGPGGGSVFAAGDGRLWLAFHSWGGGVGYRSGGYRQLHVEPIEVGAGGPRFVSAPPVGAVERVARVPGGVLVAGWSADVDSPGAVTVDVRLDGFPVVSLAADGPGGVGGRGFEVVVPAAVGPHRLCVMAVDDVGMSRPELGCADLSVSDLPFGSVDGAEPVAGGARLAGWAIDPDSAGPVVIDVYADRLWVASVEASLPRPDVGAGHPGYGDGHGWEAVVPMAPGDHEVCVYAVDTADQPSTALGCHRVAVSA